MERQRETMNFDVAGHLIAIERSVSSLERDGQPACAVTISRSYETAVENLWDAVTKSERISHWFTAVSGELEIGGRYQLEGNAGGVITECVRPSRFALTWEFGGDVSWVEVRVSGEGTGRSRITLTHTAHLSEHWDTYGPGAVGVGWELGLMGLALHISQPGEPMPDEAAFATWPDGKAIITGSSERWGQAAVVAGTDPEVAVAATRRTTAFYTGESAEPS